MTPQQKIKWLIMLHAAEWNELPLSYVTEDTVDKMYDTLVDNDEHWDSMNEVRYGNVETKVGCEYSRHYESKSVASQLPNGSWVGWAFWYGGGKHGEPDTIDWMSDAYHLDCKETEEIVIKREFNKVD